MEELARIPQLEVFREVQEGTAVWSQERWLGDIVATPILAANAGENRIFEKNDWITERLT